MRTDNFSVDAIAMEKSLPLYNLRLVLLPDLNTMSLGVEATTVHSSKAVKLQKNTSSTSDLHKIFVVHVPEPWLVKDRCNNDTLAFDPPPPPLLSRIKPALHATR